LSFFGKINVKIVKTRIFFQTSINSSDYYYSFETTHSSGTDDYTLQHSEKNEQF